MLPINFNTEKVNICRKLKHVFMYGVFLQGINTNIHHWGKVNV